MSIRRQASDTGEIRGVPGGTGASRWIVLLASVIGLAGFLYPFVLPAVADGTESQARAGFAPVLLALVTGLALLATATELGSGPAGGASKTVALLGVLVATDASLRLAPSFVGASPLFVLILLAGAAYGSGFGFQMGALTLLVSAFLTGGFGPWLPFQMLGAGWVGMTAGWLPRDWPWRRRVVALALIGAGWGFAYGALLNLWFWPVTAPGLGADASLYWVPGLSLGETLHRYVRFYALTSAWYDAFRAAANFFLVALLGGPLLMVMDRYRRRFSWEPWSRLPPDQTGSTI